jgi:hypothetical protein
MTASRQTAKMSSSADTPVKQRNMMSTCSGLVGPPGYSAWAGSWGSTRTVTEVPSGELTSFPTASVVLVAPSTGRSRVIWTVADQLPRSVRELLTLLMVPESRMPWCCV